MDTYNLLGVVLKDNSYGAEIFNISQFVVYNPDRDTNETVTPPEITKYMIDHGLDTLESNIPSGMFITLTKTVTNNLAIFKAELVDPVGWISVAI